MGGSRSGQADQTTSAFLEKGYTPLLNKVTALTGGAVTVTDVRLQEGEFPAVP